MNRLQKFWVKHTGRLSRYRSEELSTVAVFPLNEGTGRGDEAG